MRRTQLRALARALLFLGTTAGALASSGVARAQSAASLDQEFEEGFDLKTFEPAPAGDRFFSVPDAATSGDPQLYAMLLGHYTLSSTLVRTDNQTGQGRKLVQNELYAHANVSFGLLDSLLLHVDIPYAVLRDGQTGADNEPQGNQLGDIRAGARYTLAGDRGSAAAFAVGLDVWAPTGSERELTGDNSLRGGPSAMLGGKAGPIAWSTQLGYQIRKDIDTGSLSTGDSLTFGLGGGVLLLEDKLLIGPELQGSSQVNPPRGSLFDSSTTPVGLLFGAHFRVSDFVIGAGAGPSLTDAVGSAPRAVFSLAYAPPTTLTFDDGAKLSVGSDEPTKDSDNDGLIDTDDACPEQAGPVTNDPTTSGCPLEGEPMLGATGAAADEDGDGIFEDDACPDKSGPADSDPSLHGCPKDKDGDDVPDEIDSCPDEKGIASRDPDKNGCPPGKGVRKPQPEPTPAPEPPTQAEEPKPKPKPLPPVPPKANDGKPAVVHFAGFHHYDDGSSSVVVKLSAPVNVTRAVNGLELTYTLHNSKVIIRNNRNPLLATHFNSIVESARLKPKGKDVVLVIKLRSQMVPEHKVIRSGKEAALRLDFPARKRDIASE